jgi:glycosyltransferase involved in cell wall biosynthesis
MDNHRIALVVLSYNEVQGVTALAPDIAKYKEFGVDEILAVDGGSTDGTLEVYAAHGIPVVKQTSRGRGEAMRLAAQESTADFLIFFSPDGNEDWRDIAKFRGYFEQGYDLVIASRMMAGAHNEEDDQWLRSRKWANNAFNFLANAFFRHDGPYISDSINGFRGIRRSVLIELKLDAVGYTIEYQMTMRALERKLKIVEFPTHEGARIGGESKAQSIPTGLRFIRCLWEEIRSPDRRRSSH